MTDKYECEHKLSKLGDNYCSVCGVRFDKKFSRQDLLERFKILDRLLGDRMRLISGGQTSYSRDGYRGMGEAVSVYKEWKLENFGI